MSEVLQTELTMIVSRIIPAAPARIYDAWLDPAMLRRFMVPCDGGTVPEATTDPHVGGNFRIVMHDGNKDIPHHGTYLELVPHQHLIFTWQSPHSIEGSVVTVTLTPVEGGTRIDLRQDRFASESLRDGHRKGWAYILNELVATPI